MSSARTPLIRTTRRHRTSWCAAIVFALLATLHFSSAQIFAEEDVPEEIPSIGISEDPGEDLQPLEHHLMHSATHLQGTPAAEKVSAAIHLPGLNSPFSEMITFVIVNNPSTTQQLNGTIEYYDPNGALVGTSPFRVDPEGHYRELATPLAGQPWGTVRVFKNTDGDPDFVGATVFHTYLIGVDPSVITNMGGNQEQLYFGGEPGVGEYTLVGQNHLTRVGAHSMQQLQVAQADRPVLFWGPLPFRNNFAGQEWDFVEGNAPLPMVTNPNPFPVNISIFVANDQGAAPPPVNTLTLQPFASFVDVGLFNTFVNAHNNGPAYDWNLGVLVIGDGPLVGQGILFDLFGADPTSSDGNMRLLDRFRMGSAMMSNTSVTELVASDFVSEVGPIATNTLIGISNTSGQDIGPIDIEYRDRNGTLVATATQASLPPTQVIIIGPGVLNYPAGVFAGSVTVRSDRAGMTGWSMRSTEHPGPAGPNPDGETPVQFELRKAWGEVLDGGNGIEPGTGYEGIPSDGLTRKLGPLNLVRTTLDGIRPRAGYNVVYNDGVSNVGPYSFRTFLENGNEITDFSLQPFAGLAFEDTAFTYLDNLVPLVANPNGATFVNTKFEHENPRVSGVNAIGDYSWQWPWTNGEVYIGPPPGPTYAGPGDVVPNP